MTKKRTVMRFWLHPETHSSNRSFIVAECTNEKWDNPNLTIGDCYKNITLEFSSKKGAALAKIAKIRRALDFLEERINDQ